MKRFLVLLLVLTLFTLPCRADQYDFGTIDPDTTSGTDLATLLGDWRDALNSGHSGTSRPSYATGGTVWVDTTSSTWVVKIFDGTDDITLGTVSTTGNQFTPYYLGSAVGSMAAQASSSVSITGGTITGITDLAVADGGSGASTASGARTNFGLVIGTDVEAHHSNLTCLSGLTAAADKYVYFTGASTCAVGTVTSFARTILDDTDAATMRATMGLGSAATLTAGTSANNAVQLDGSAKLPAVDGSQLTNLPSAGSFTLMDSETASASSNLNLIATTTACSAYLVVLEDLRVSTNNSRVYLRTSTDGGSTYASASASYNQDIFWATISGLEAGTETLDNTPSTTEIRLSSRQLDNPAADALSGSVRILNPGATAVNKGMFWESFYQGNYHDRGFGNRASTADIDAVRVLPSTGNFTSGKAYLYCVKNS